MNHEAVKTTFIYYGTTNQLFDIYRS